MTYSSTFATVKTAHFSLLDMIGLICFKVITSINLSDLLGQQFLNKAKVIMSGYCYYVYYIC